MSGQQQPWSGPEGYCCVSDALQASTDGAHIGSMRCGGPVLSSVELGVGALAAAGRLAVVTERRLERPVPEILVGSGCCSCLACTPAGCM